MTTAWDRRSGVYDSSTADYTFEEQDITLEVSSAPTQSIVSKAEAKNFLKIDSDITADDDLINSMIVGASGILERELGGLALYEQTITQKQQGNCEHIRLMRTPVIGTPTVSYYEDFDTVTATNVTVTTYFRQIGDKLIHADGYFERGRDGDGYTVTYKAGLFTASNYTSSQDVRLGAFKNAMLRIIARMYEQREQGTTTIGEGNWSISYDDETMYDVRKLIMPFHTGRGIL